MSLPFSNAWGSEMTQPRLGGRLFKQVLDLLYGIAEPMKPTVQPSKALAS